MSFSNEAFSSSFGVGFDRVAPPVVVAPTLLDNRLFVVVVEHRDFIVQTEKRVFEVDD